MSTVRDVIEKSLSIYLRFVFYPGMFFWFAIPYIIRTVPINNPNIEYALFYLLIGTPFLVTLAFVLTNRLVKEARCVQI
jgi:hypothetical protein